LTLQHLWAYEIQGQAHDGGWVQIDYGLAATDQSLDPLVGNSVRRGKEPLGIEQMGLADVSQCFHDDIGTDTSGLCNVAGDFLLRLGQFRATPSGQAQPLLWLDAEDPAAWRKAKME